MKITDKKIIMELKKEIGESDRYYEKLQDKHKQLMKTINALKVSIPIIFERIGCNAEDYTHELLDTTTVNESNMLQYLAIIEKKTNEILQMYFFSQNKGQNAQEGFKNDESVLSGSTFLRDKENKDNENSQLKELLSQNNNQMPIERDNTDNLPDYADFLKFAKAQIDKKMQDKKRTRGGKPNK